MDGSQIEYFSDEFNELCTQMGANPVPANNPLGAGAWEDWDGETLSRNGSKGPTSDRTRHEMEIRPCFKAYRGALDRLQCELSFRNFHALSRCSWCGNWCCLQVLNYSLPLFRNMCCSTVD